MFCSEGLLQRMQINMLINNNRLRKAEFDITISGNTYVDTNSVLLENCIVFKIIRDEEEVYWKVQFNFDLLFQADFKDGKEINSIKLIREKEYLTITSPKCSKQLLIWRDYLGKNINQIGFHGLFKAIKKIGKGKFASVYLVQRHEDQKQYAVKAFSKQSLYTEQKGKYSLMKEIEVMKNINHKNLMKLYGVYETDHSIYLQLQLLKGGLLSDKMKLQRGLTMLQTKIIMKGILQGLEAMHKKNIMHRDIKPQNIIFRKDYDFDCVIADFGLAESETNQEYLYVRCGTPGFVAPEIVNTKDPKIKYTCACDLFSVGIIFHMLLLKESPFPGKQYNEILRQNRACKISFQAIEYKQLSQIQLDLLIKLLKKDPDERITAKEALTHPFFHNDFTFGQKKRMSNLLKIQPRLLKKQDSSLAKNTEVIREDSCLKFKMKENTITGKLEGENTQVFNTPPEPKRNSVKGNSMGGLNRFGRISHIN